MQNSAMLRLVANQLGEVDALTRYIAESHGALMEEPSLARAVGETFMEDARFVVLDIRCLVAALRDRLSDQLLFEEYGNLQPMIAGVQQAIDALKLVPSIASDIEKYVMVDAESLPLEMRRQEINVLRFASSDAIELLSRHVQCNIRFCLIPRFHHRSPS